MGTPEGRDTAETYRDAMTPDTRPSEPAGGDELMMVVAAAVILVVAGEAAFVASASWLLLPFTLLGVSLAAVVVIFALLRTIDSDTAIPTPKASPRPKAQPAPAPIRGTALAGR